MMQSVYPCIAPRCWARNAVQNTGNKRGRNDYGDLGAVHNQLTKYERLRMTHEKQQIA